MSMQRIIYGSNWWLAEENLRLMVAVGKLPDLKRAMEKLPASGSFFNVSVPFEIEELEAELEINGPDPRLRRCFGREAGDWVTLFYYERIKDILGGANVGRVVRLKGLITEVGQPKTRQVRAEGALTVTMTSIVLYHDLEDGKTMHKFDYFSNRLVVDGVDLSATHNQLIAA